MTDTTNCLLTKVKQLAMLDAYDYDAGCKSELGAEWKDFPLVRYTQDQQMQDYYETQFMAYLQALRNTPKSIW